MADVSHLEKMGRELMCPICLSLLKCAASIACNHVFCNSCIVNSMKKESNCPICKVPFHRREIRPAPHMDNLVGIYKSMETASGVHMFMSESAPNSQLPEMNTDTLAEASKHQQIDSQRSGGSHVRSSFPCKKRVQVAHYPLPETPVHSSKVGSLVSEGVHKELKNKAVSNSTQTQRERSRSDLSPFFWLRDNEDAENLSQQSDGTSEANVTPPAALSFSDIKDSDDESPEEDNTQGEMFGKSPVVDLSDNEMLEWTQRPCSPQLCSLPMKSQIRAVQEEQLEVQDRNTFESQPSTDADHHLILGQGTSLTTMQQPHSVVNKNSAARKPSKRKKKSRICKTIMKNATNVGPLGVDGTSKNQDHIVKQNSKFSKCEVKATKPRKKSAKFETTPAFALDAKAIPSASIEKLRNSTNKVVGMELGNLLEKGRICTESETSKFTGGSRSKSISDSCSRSRKRRLGLSKIVELKDLSENDNIVRNVEPSPVCVEDNCLSLTKQRRILHNEFSEAENKGSHIEALPVPVTKSSLSSRSQNLRSVKTLSLKEPAGNESNRKVHENLQDLQEDSCVQSSSKQQDLSKRAPLKDLSEVEDSPAIPRNIMVDNQFVSGEKLGKYSLGISSSKEMRSSRKLNVSAIDISVNPSVARGLPSKIMQTAKSVHENTRIEVSKNSTGQEKSRSSVQEVPLRKCGSIRSKIQCAFCQSAEASKPYGKIIHYFDGRPVSADHNEGSNLIHSHRHCAEWAPNVYFEDDTAINLKAELARSRRISCSCCGVKGAALGCYHNSCHRSFHVPCAKLMPECRWDTENYVMLCPLHASSKLPCEMSVSERKRKRTSEMKSVQESAITTSTPKIDWKGGSHRSLDQIVLCGSALADFDKDVVSQFKMLSGVKESKKWSSSVTHVIASVDENGACRRTLKILMAILDGKWILSVKWLKACIDAKRLVDEQPYEITVDIHGIRDGPRLGRLRFLNKEPKLFNGLEFFFYGEFAGSYKGYLQDLITAGGGTILHRKPIVTDQSRPSTFIIYNLELPEKYDPSKKDMLLNKRISEANALANSTGAIAASNTWILNSIAACQLQITEE